MMWWKTLRRLLDVRLLDVRLLDVILTGLIDDPVAVIYARLVVSC